MNLINKIPILLSLLINFYLTLFFLVFKLFMIVEHRLYGNLSQMKKRENIKNGN